MSRPMTEQPGETSLRIVELVAVAEGTPPANLPPLYDAIDPEALDAIFGGDTDATGRLEFDYSGYTVVVDTEDGVTLAD